MVLAVDAESGLPMDSGDLFHIRTLCSSYNDMTCVLYSSYIAYNILYLFVVRFSRSLFPSSIILLHGWSGNRIRFASFLFIVPPAQTSTTTSVL